MPGKDGQIWGVVLKVFDGTNNRFIKRPIEKLYPIEVKAQCPVDKNEIAQAKNTIDDSFDHSDNIREPRRAADAGILIRRLTGQS